MVSDAIALYNIFAELFNCKEIFKEKIIWIW